ncbi:MAG: hypothetical protein AAGH40_02025 [Verrucomicrobiota bacterium]
MDLFHTTDSQGISIINPDRTAMRELIATLDDVGISEVDHPDVSLVHDASGWSITLYPNGVAALENLDEESEPRYLSNVSRSDALKLWIELSVGNIEALLIQPWLAEA